MALSRSTLATLTAVTLALLATTGCTPYGCYASDVEAAVGEAAVGYTTEEVRISVDGDHEFETTEVRSGELVQGSVMLELGDSQWQEWIPEDPSVEDCAEPRLTMTAEFALVLDGIDIAGTIEGQTYDKNSVGFSMYVTPGDLDGGVDVSDRGYETENLLLDITLTRDTGEVEVRLIDFEGSDRYEA